MLIISINLLLFNNINIMLGWGSRLHFLIEFVSHLSLFVTINLKQRKTKILV